MKFDVKERKSSLISKRHKGHFQKTTKERHAAFSKVWDDCVSAYLLGIVTHWATHSGKNHGVDTGMSMASLLPLARYVRMYTYVKSQIHPAAKKKHSYVNKKGKTVVERYKKGVFDINGVWDPNGIRSISAGEASSKQRAGYNVLYGSPKRMVFRFDFEIRVWQYLVNEYGKGHIAAWNSLEAGREAFIEHYNTYWLPEVMNKEKWGLEI